MDGELHELFTGFSAAKLRQLAGRIEDCLGRLSYEQIWARGSDAENATGNLVLHLCGNLRQWVGAGIAGKPDIRVRDREFRARGDIQAGELRERLKGAVAEAVETIEGLDAGRLRETVNVQGYDVSVLEAVYHVVEHFAQHTGQILYATKQMTRQDLGYYSHLGQGGGQGVKTP